MADTWTRSPAQARYPAPVSSYETRQDLARTTPSISQAS